MKADSHGNWSYGVPTNLADGAHKFAITVSGSGETTATNVASAVLTVDTKPPSITLQVPAFADYRAPVFEVAASDANGVVATFHIDIDLKHDGKFTDPGDQSVANGVLNASGYGTVQLPLALATGTYSVAPVSRTGPATPAPVRPRRCTSTPTPATSAPSRCSTLRTASRTERRRHADWSEVRATPRPDRPVGPVAGQRAADDIAVEPVHDGQPGPSGNQRPRHGHEVLAADGDGPDRARYGGRGRVPQSEHRDGLHAGVLADRA